MGTIKARALGGAVVALMLSAAVSCTWPGTKPPQPGTRYSQPVFSRIQKIASATTFGRAPDSSGAAVDLKLDMWAPAGDTAAKRPAIVWMFGGAFVAGSRSMMSSYAQDSARRGYVGITIDYRLVKPQANLVEDVRVGAPVAYDDAMTAADWLKANAGRYHIDPDAIVAGGFSAGAINAIDTIVLPGRRGPASSPFAAAISNSGASLGAITGEDDSAAGQRPIIMFAGTADNVVQYQNWQVRTCDAQKAKGNVCEFVSYQGQGHGVGGKMTDLLNRSAQFVVQQVLTPLGYATTT
jgi:carboxylesterase type B